MNTRLIVNALLLLLLGGLTIVALKPSKDAEKTPPPVTSITPTAIEQIHIERQNQPDITLVLADGGWQMQEPLQVPALPGKMDRLLKLAEIKSFAQYPLGDTDPSRYGLNPPTARIRYNDTQIEFGAVEPISSRRYTRIDDELHLVDDTFMHHLMGPVTDYIDTKLLPQPARITRLKLPGLHLVYSPDSGWQNLSQNEQPQNQDQVQILLDEWRFARAIRVEPLAQSPIGQDAFITFENQPDLHLVIDNQADHLRISNPEQGLIYHFSHTKAEKLLRLPPASDTP